MTASLSAIVLAGGKSQRMGRDKALIEVNGRPLLGSVYDVARQCAHPVYIMTSRVESYRPILPEDSCFIAEAIPPNETIPPGPLVAFAQALEVITSSWVLLLACDLPNLKTNVLQTAIAQLDTVPPDAIAFLSRDENCWQPLCGFYRHICYSPLQRFIEQGGRSFQHWLDESAVQELRFSDPSILFNCNTPQDLQQTTEHS